MQFVLYFHHFYQVVDLYEMYQQVFRGRKQGHLTAKNLWPNHLDTKHNRYFYEQMKEWIETDG